MVNISADIPAHDDDLVGDELTTLIVNYRWRRIITPLLLPLTRDDFWTGTPTEIEDATYKAIDLIEDLYTPDVIGGDMNYLGAFIGRTTSILATLAGVFVSFGTPSGSLTHDVGGFFDPAEPERLTVPIGGAGFYHCHARGLAFGSVNSGVIRIHRGISGVQTSAISGDPNAVSLHCAVVTFFDEGEFIILEARTISGTRLFSPYSLNPNAFEFGMYRVGVVAP
ncbi:hypothetical protein LCGC14_1130130 [marine sediment metagenome]|uniref:Uncharacterized protein n=1 Tax=marine sediment metagenome TaxID=412755 RepID=A0A0F9M673_9ZZZZ